MRHALLLIAIVALASPVLAQPSRVLEGREAEEALAAHNAARARFGVPPLRWDPALSEIALRCIRENRGRPFRHCDTPHGENMYASTRPAQPGPAVTAWMSEEPDYEVENRRCRDFSCGHFTQVIWYSTERVGCAVGPGEAEWNNLICNYDPPGNYGYMGDAAGERHASGSWFYFDPPPFGGSPPIPPASRTPTAQPAGVPQPTTPPSAPAVEARGAIDWEVPWALEGDTFRSGAVADGQQSVMRATVDGPGQLTFRWRVSSEDLDELAFEVNGREVLDPISGESGWVSVTVDLPQGSHALAWIYRKDEDTSEGSDAGWVDQVRFSAR